MTSRSKTLAVAVLVEKERLQDMMLVVPDPFEQSFVSVLGELGQSGSLSPYRPNTSTDECFDALFVGSGAWRGIEQLGQDYGSVYCFQRVVTHTVSAKNFNSTQRLSTLANNVTYI